MRRFASREKSQRSSDLWAAHSAVLAKLSQQYARAGYERSLYRLLAYLGRYARQPLQSVLPLTLSECRLLATATEALMEAEAKSAQP